MGMRVRPPFRADHVGSLLRPKSLLHLRERWKTGKADLRELRAHEDLCIAEVVKIQEELGLNAVTDGEFRRESFHVDFIGKIKNVTSSWDFDAAVKLGEEDRAGENKQMPYIPYINGTIGLPEEGIEVNNYNYTSSKTALPVKVTLPSPTMTHFRGGRDAIDKEAYPEMDDFFSDLSLIYRQELARLADAGCRYVQFDDTNLAYLCDEKMRENVT